MNGLGNASVILRYPIQLPLLAPTKNGQAFSAPSHIARVITTSPARAYHRYRFTRQALLFIVPGTNRALLNKRERLEPIFSFDELNVTGQYSRRSVVSTSQNTKKYTGHVNEDLM